MHNFVSNGAKKTAVIVSLTALILVAVMLVAVSVIMGPAFLVNIGTASKVSNDDFESGDYTLWPGTTTSGGFATVSSVLPYNGTYSAQFTINPGTGTRRAYCYEHINNLAELSASAYINIADRLPLSPDSSIWMIQFVDSRGAALASFGVKADESGLWWAVQNGEWPYSITGIGPNPDTWYKIEAYFTHAAFGRTIVLYVDDVEIASLSIDTSTANYISSIRFGIGYATGNSAVTVHMDEIDIDKTPQIEPSA